MTVVRTAHLEVTPWKNGKGRKADVAHGDGWFVGLAWIEADAPFSHFPGTQRTCVLVEGAGFTLTFYGFPPAVYRVPGDVHAFRGDLPAQATTAGGPSLVFNVMTSVGSWTHDVVVTGTLAAQGFAAILHGTVEAEGGPAGPGDVLVLPHDGAASHDLLVAVATVTPVPGPPG
jgi:hypothetical protein